MQLNSLSTKLKNILKNELAFLQKVNSYYTRLTLPTIGYRFIYANGAQA